MKHIKRYIYIILVFASLFLGNFFQIIQIPNNEFITSTPESENLHSNEILGGFLIDGQQGWIDFKTAGYCTGYGNSTYPYLIKDLHINGEFAGSCLTIRNSDLYFIITNCTIYNSRSGYDFGGIFLDNTTNGDIFNNTLYNNGCGIYLEGSTHNYIHNNTARDNSYYGLCIRHDSDYNVISDNYIHHNSNMGIYHDQSKNNTISFNFVSDHSSSGLYFMYNDNITITNNTVSRNAQGIDLNRETHHSIIINNTLEDNSLSSIKIGFTDYCHIYNNIIKNPGRSGITLWNSKYNVVEENYVYSSVEYGIMLDRARYNTIRENILEENQKHGIYVTDFNDIQTSIYNEIINNDLINNVEYGIFLEKKSNSNKIYFNNLTGNQAGCIFISGNSVDNELLLNLCDEEYLPIVIDDNGYVGITWSKAREYNVCIGSGTLIDPYVIENIHFNAHHMSHGIEIANSTVYFEIRDCKIYQSQTDDSYAGILLNNVQNGKILYNNIVDNNGNGITLRSSSSNIIYENIIAFNSYIGIKIGFNSNDNLIYMNNFTTNGLHAQDFGIGNNWNNSLIGNYWDNYSGLDMNEDGIGDTPYYSGNITDYLPIWYIKIAPNITIISPNKSHIFSLIAPQFELDIETYGYEIISSWYCLNYGVNYTFSGTTGNINQSAWDACENGTITIRFYVKNIVNNIGYSDVKIHKDIYYPLIQINSPLEMQLFGNVAPEYNVTVTSNALDLMWYTLNNGSKSFFTEFIGTINHSAWDVCGNGTVLLKFFANNSFGELNYDEIILRKDSSTPSITIIQPFNNELFREDSADYEVLIDDPKLEKKWYKLNDGISHFFNLNNGTFNQSAWDACGNGTISIKFYANNTIGNVAYAEVIVRRELYYPLIDIHSPLEKQNCGLISPYYNITVHTKSLDSMWYTLNGGSNHIIIGFEGTINQSSWDLISEGPVIIRFYANNTFGQVNYEVVTVNKLENVMERNAYAIIIGISDYPGSSNDLSYCDDDAIAVYDMLINDYNFKPENIIYLQDSSATKNDINNAFSAISSIIKEDDIFFFYYSGHGGHGTYSTQGSWNVETLHPYWNNYDQIWSVSHPGALYMRVHFERFQTEAYYDYALCGDWGVTQGYYYEELTGNLGYNFWSSYIPVSSYYIRFISDYSNTDYGFKIDKYEAILEDGTHYLCSYDSIPSNPSAYYMDTLLDSKLDSINCADKYVVLDSCNSGGLIPEVQDIGRYIMTACRGTEESLETPLLEHGIFTYFLLESNDNANDENGDGVISMEECYSYVYSNTRSYSGSFGSEYLYSPQESDGIGGEAVLSPSIGSVWINPVDNRLYYSFYLYGHGFLKTLNITVCSISPAITYTTEALKDYFISLTGFGYYSGFIDLQEGYTAGGIQLYAEIDGNTLITIDLMIGDSDGDGLTDFFEIMEGLDPNLNDTDSDGLNDYDEYYGPTDPLNSDTDSDGLLDGEEVNIYNTNPVDSDTDSDGLLDGEEVNLYNTDPLNSDSDSDNLSDGDEINIHFTNPLNNDTDSDNILDGNEINIYNTNPLSNDTDSDNLSDFDEIFTYNTSPLLNDTDSDGLSDYDEIFLYNTDPLEEDTDSDGLTDYDELSIHNTDPLDDDTDSDTIPDGWEVDNSLDPLTNDTALDPDMDSLTNLEEYQANTDPQNSDTDSDGLFDGEEVKTHYTDPLSSDTDSDTMPDKWEVENLLNPLVNDTALDPDNDLLVNLLEYEYNTDPQNPDTDGDGWTDGDEVLVYDTDPLDPLDHPNPRSSQAVPGYTLHLVLLSIVLISIVWFIKNKRKYLKN